MNQVPSTSEVPIYDRVPPKWVSTSDTPALDIPAFAQSPARRRAVIAMNARSGDPLVSFRCGVQKGDRQCRDRLGGVWATNHGDVLVVQDQVDSSLAEAYKTNLDPGHGSDNFRESPAEQPILVEDVRSATTYCPRHGPCEVVLDVLRRQLKTAKATGKTQHLAVVPGR